MKYSLQSLFVVVSLAAIVSGFVARSRFCAEQAAFHRSQLPSSEEELRFTLKWLEDLRTESPLPTPQAPRHAHMMMGLGVSPEGMARFARMEAQLRFHEEAAIAYERASGMPWLPVNIPPEPPPIEAPE